MLDKNIGENSSELVFLQNLLYGYFYSEISDLVLNRECSNYSACTFSIKNVKFLYRKAKITPTKIGQFVTVWKRSANQIIIPYSLNDKLDYYIISAQNEEHRGYFVFPIKVLCAKGIVADQNNEGGKRGFRVYPTWDKTNNKQAENSQKWQINYFFNYSSNLLNFENVSADFRKFFIKIY